MPAGSGQRGGPAAVPARTVCLLESVTLLQRGLGGLVVQWDAGAALIVADDPPAAVAAAPDLVVCGPSAIRALIAHYLDEVGPMPATLAVVLDPADVDYPAALASGVETLWDAAAPAATFAAAVEAALRREPWLSETLTGRLAADVGIRLRRDREASRYGLTNREIEILRLLATGMSNQDIAARLFISTNTVKNHVRSVLEKLQASSRTEAVVIGARLGLVDVSDRRDR